MSIRNKLFGLGALVLALALPASPALAAGSDGPTPYTVTEEGIYLPAGQVFQDNGHVNIKTSLGPANVHFEAKCITRTDAECAGDRHAQAQFIGKSSIPWTAFGLGKKPFCVTWVQLSQYNEHYGEGGQGGVGTGCATPPPLPPDVVVEGEWRYTVDCDTKVGDTIPMERDVQTTRYSFKDGQLVSTVTSVEETGTHTVTAVDLLGLNCSTPTPTPTPTPTEPPLPETGGHTDGVLVAAVVGSGLLVAGALLFRRRTQV